jgi:hypothetical protein
MKFTTIPIDKINLSDERFRISHYFPLDNLIQSIKVTGLVNPPVLVNREDQPIVLSGWKRILACQRLAFDIIPVFVSGEVADLDAFKIPVYENLALREYNQIEKADILKKLKQFGQDEKGLIREFLPLLGIPPTPKHLKLYLEFSNFVPALREIIHKKNINFAVLQVLVEFKPQVREALIPFLLPLGQNKQKELVTNLYEISRRERIPAVEVLTSKSIVRIQKDKNLSPIQKADKIRILLKQRRNPTLTTWAQTFESILEKLNLSKGVVVSPTPFFESDDMSLNLSFKNREEFIQKLSKLQDLSKKKEFSDLFKSPSDE